MPSCAWPRISSAAGSTGSRCRCCRGCCTPLGRLLVYGPLRDNLGMRRIRIAYTAGEAIGPEIFVFFRALGINVKQLYGMTEASVFVAVQRDGDVRLDTVGTPMPGVEIKISASGEVLFRSPGVFQGYFKNPEATRQTLEDGWIHSGDAGFLDQAGHLKIIDRARDLGRLADGTVFAPKYLENKLKFSPYVKEAVALGPGRPYVTALVNIDLAVGRELGGAAGHCLYELHRPQPEARGLRAHRAGGGAGEPEPGHRGRGAAGGADPQVPAPAQGARSRRRGDHPHPQGAAGLHRREVRAAHRGAVRRRATT